MNSFARDLPPAPPLSRIELARIELDAGPIIQEGRRNSAKWLGTLISFAVLAAALWQWRNLDMTVLHALMPVTLGFWLAYCLYYLSGPASEWIIFRRLWNLPPAGIIPLIRKKISNELVFGYVGEAYFYSWARRRSHLTAAPFGAIKDVAILSALAGNVVTLLMLAAGFPVIVGLVQNLDLDLSQRALAVSVGFMALVSILLLFWRKHVLSLPAGELRFVIAVHCVRIVITICLLALIWHLALPNVSLLWWILLSMLRQLVSRLPFVPNKDVIFASLAIFFVGDDAMIIGLMAFLAGLILATHLALGSALVLIELFDTYRPRAAAAGSIGADDAHR